MILYNYVSYFCFLCSFDICFRLSELVVPACCCKGMFFDMKRMCLVTFRRLTQARTLARCSRKLKREPCPGRYQFSFSSFYFSVISDSGSSAAFPLQSFPPIFQNTPRSPSFFPSVRHGTDSAYRSDRRRYSRKHVFPVSRSGPPPSYPRKFF